ncbi:MAG: PilT/PilU family type 4a pilus ATPase [Candidatus Omnitrophica bacterium]|nr:PilT/PilU family type 4a pilus ATPase [Candidatus Omnitrophota bacterium]
MELKKIDDLLEMVISKEASDLHLVVGNPPIVRIHGNLEALGSEILTEETIKRLIFQMLPEKQQHKFIQERELDSSYSYRNDYQFRVNAHFEKGHMATTIRATALDIDTILRFGLPEPLKKIAVKKKGLFIVSGTSGSGKSTTLTYIVNMINNSEKRKIVTIEDPIEYTHKSKKSLVIQREVGVDTPTFASALKYSLRQDPDVIVIGEIRDFEAVSMAMTAAETGHLVLTTVHAPDAVETLNRIIDVYPAGYREQVLAQLAGNLIGICSQTLVPRKDSNERVLATELLLTSISIRNLIRRGALIELRGQLDSEEDSEMHTFEKSLSDLAIQGIISKETAYDHAKYPKSLKFGEDPYSNIRKSAIAKVKELDSDNQIDQAEITEKVLVIDRSDKDRISISKILKELGYINVGYVVKGIEAYNKVITEKPSLVILDTFFPDVDSFDLCKKIKSTADLNTKVIMVTVSLQPNDLQDAKSAGADDFVVKTSQFDLLKKTLQQRRSA